MAVLFVAGSSQYCQSVSVPHNALAYPATLAAWVKITTLPAANGEYAILGIYNNATTTDYWQIVVRESGGAMVVRAREHTNNTPNATTGVATFPVNTWVHVAGTFISSTSRNSFLNGSDKQSNTGSEGLPTTPNVVTIGRTSESTPVEYMSGMVCDAAIWAAELTDGEILSLATQRLRPSDIRQHLLRAWWPLDIPGMIQPDLSGRGHHVTQFAGATVWPDSPFRINNQDQDELNDDYMEIAAGAEDGLIIGGGYGARLIGAA